MLTWTQLQRMGHDVREIDENGSGVHTKLVNWDSLTRKPHTGCLGSYSCTKGEEVRLALKIILLNTDPFKVMLASLCSY